MSQEGWIALLMGVPVGIISGLYSGLIVARYQRFSELRARLLRIIREIDFIGDEKRITFPARKDVPELTPIASDFFFLQHTDAGEQTLRLQTAIKEAIYLGSLGRIDSELFGEKFLEWQEGGRRLKPNVLQLLRLWGGL